MKFGVISLDFKRFSLETCFKMAARYGLDGVEIWGGRPHAYFMDMSDKRINEILGYKKKYKLEVPMYTPYALNGPYNLCSKDDKTREDTLGFFLQSIDITSKIECRRMLVVAEHPGYETNMEESYRIFIDNMKTLGERAKKQGVILTIEPLTPMESPLITTSDDCVKAIADIGLDCIEAMIDVAPLTVAYEPVSSYFEKLKDKMNYIHICNNDGMTDAHTRLENGVIPIEDMFRVFKNWNYNDYITCELYSENYKDPEMFLANTMRILGDIRERLGV